MDFPLSYFEDEVRDGFLIPSIMKKNWAANYNAYEALCSLCDRLGLKVFANWGTLLGAVRHGGIIPWDDDIDVEMLRSEYLVLEEYRKKSGFPKDYWMLGYSSDKIFNSIIKFADYKNLIVHPDDWKEHCGFPFAAVVDIFMLDCIPSGDAERERYETIVQNAMAIEQEEDGEKYFGVMAEWLGLTFSGTEPKSLQLTKALDKYLTSFSGSRSERQTYLWHYLMYSKNRAFPNEFHDDMIEIPFELGTMRVPVGYDGILRLSYGDYMNAVRTYDNHGYPNYKEMEEKLERVYHSSLLRYEYKPEIVRENQRKKIEKISLQKQLVSSLELLHEAHQFVLANLNNAENIEGVLDVLGQCQNLAIQMGTQIEEEAVQGTETVRLLEDYCNVVFSLYEFVCDGRDDIGRTANKLTEYEIALRERIMELKEKKQVVFLPYKAAHWKSLHTVWEEYNSREDMVVTVIPVPYYYRDLQCEVTKEMICETDGYPDGVTITSYSDYNFEVHHPDMVIYQFPYDEYSYALTLHPFFYTSNLVKYTQKMVFIPPFQLHEIEAQDNRSRYTLGCFVKNPGLIYADEIVVQSEKMKEVYIELLDEFTRVDAIGTIDWDKKIRSEGFPLLEWERRQRTLIKNKDTGEFFERNGTPTGKTIYDTILEIPGEWMSKIRRENGTHKKIIVYYVSGSMLLEYRERAVKKMEQVLELAEKYKDEILFLWHTDSYARAILRKRASKVWSSYREMVERFVKDDIGILDDSGDYHRAGMLADAYYGDGGVAMNECRMLGKPIMWENPEVAIDS